MLFKGKVLMREEELGKLPNALAEMAFLGLRRSWGESKSTNPGGWPPPSLEPLLDGLEGTAQRLLSGRGSPPPHWPPGLLPSPSLQALAHALTERGLWCSSVLPTLEGLLPEPPYYHHPLFLRATPLLSGPECLEPCPLPPSCSSSSGLSPSSLSSPSCPALSVPSAFSLGQMSITNGLESEAGISRTPIRSL